MYVYLICMYICMLHIFFFFDAPVKVLTHFVRQTCFHLNLNSSRPHERTTRISVCYICIRVLKTLSAHSCANSAINYTINVTVCPAINLWFLQRAYDRHASSSPLGRGNAARHACRSDFCVGVPLPLFCWHSYHLPTSNHLPEWSTWSFGVGG